jgi:hypothetical protein
MPPAMDLALAKPLWRKQLDKFLPKILLSHLSSRLSEGREEMRKPHSVLPAWVVPVCTSLALTTATEAAGPPYSVYSAQGFEQPAFVPGSAHQQNGLIALASGGGTVPAIVSTPAPAVGQQSLQFTVPNVGGSWSGIDIHFPSPVSAGYTGVTYSFDSYRVNDGWLSNLYFGFQDENTNAYLISGLQWDTAAANTSRVYGFGFASGDTSLHPLVAINRWATTTLSWDFVAKTATVSYDGQVLGTRAYPSANPQSIYATVFLLHDEATGLGPETVWIDNVTITAVPEPGAASTLIIFAAVTARRARNRPLRHAAKPATTHL